MTKHLPIITPSILATLHALGIDAQADRPATDDRPGFIHDRTHILAALSTTDAGNPRKVLGSSIKTRKGRGRGIRTRVLYMAPAASAGIVLCPWASAGCAAACLGHSSGHLRWDANQRVLAAKALWFHLFRGHFLARLDKEIRQHTRTALRAGDVPAVRLNGSTDILWERHVNMAEHPATTFYDYTKAPLKTRRPAANYHLTASIDERPSSMARALDYIRAGYSAAVVVQTEDGQTVTTAKRAAAALIAAGAWNGYPTIDGDKDDARFLDAPGSWVVLFAKGTKAPRDRSGFVQRVAA